MVVLHCTLLSAWLQRGKPTILCRNFKLLKCNLQHIFFSLTGVFPFPQPQVDCAHTVTLLLKQTADDLGLQQCHLQFSQHTNRCIITLDKPTVFSGSHGYFSATDCYLDDTHTTMRSLTHSASPDIA